MIDLSIIIPAYITSEKGREDLEALVKKIIGQMNPNQHELFIIDDGSPDKEIIRPICDIIFDNKGVFLYRNARNCGVARARNQGINYTSGEYIVFIDADDDIPQDFIEILDDRISIGRGYSRAETDKPAIADIIQFQAKYQDGSVGYPTPCAWGKLIKRSWIGEDRFDEDQLIGEEDTLFLKKPAAIIRDDRIIYYHRQDANPDSLMKRYWRGEIPRRRGEEPYKGENNA